MLAKERTHGLSATKGSLCMFGSTEFVSQFQAQWQKDGYCDYTQPPQEQTLSGTHVGFLLIYFLFINFFLFIIKVNLSILLYHHIYLQFLFVYLFISSGMFFSFFLLKCFFYCATRCCER